MDETVKICDVNGKKALQMEFIELLFREHLINKETYYKAKEILKEEK